MSNLMMLQVKYLNAELLQENTIILYLMVEVKVVEVEIMAY